MKVVLVLLIFGLAICIRGEVDLSSFLYDDDDNSTSHIMTSTPRQIETSGGGPEYATASPRQIETSGGKEEDSTIYMSAFIRTGKK